MDFRDRVELGFENLGHWVCRHPWSAIVGTLLLSCILCVGVSNLRFEGSTENYIDPNDPARVAYNEFRAQFVYDDFLLLLVRSEHLFSPEILEKLRALHHDIENELPNTEEVTSLINARLTRGAGDTLVVGELMEDWPKTPEDFAAVEKLARTSPLYRNIFLSEDGRTAAINIRVKPSQPTAGDALDGFAAAQASPAPPTPKHVALLDGEELDATVEKMQEIVARYQSEDFTILTTGLPEMTYSLVHECTRDTILFMSLSEVLIFILLFIQFRRASGVLIPLAVVTLAVFVTFGVMGLLDLPLTPSTQFLPSFILVASIGNCVHLLALFYERFDEGVSKEKAIVQALSHSGLAVVMTNLTTAVSLSAFAFSDLIPVRSAGIASPIGVMLALVYSIVLLPALVCVCPIRPRAARKESGALGLMDKILLGFGGFSTRRPWTVALVWSVLLGVGTYYALQLRPSHDTMRWFPPGFPTRVAADTANAELKGVMTVEVVVDTKKENGLVSPAMMNRLDQAEQFAEQVREGYLVAGQSVSLVDIVKETHQALNGNDPAFYAIPQEQELLAQELLLFESSGSDDLGQVVDSQFQRARISLRVPFEDGFFYIPYVAKIERGVQDIFGDTATVKVTGLTALFLSTITAMVSSTFQSYSYSVLTVAPLMIILVGELTLGLLSLVPNLIPIVLGLGFMKLANIPFDMFTMMIGSIAIGTSVDDTIHFMHTYRRYYRHSGDSQKAVQATLLSSGRGMLLTAVALSGGFLIQVFGQMVSVRNLGIATGFIIGIAVFADLTLSPAIVTLLARFQKPPPTVMSPNAGH